MKIKRLVLLLSLLIRILRIKLSSANDKDIRVKKAIFAGFSDLGGVYIKFLQMMAMSTDFMKGWAGPSEFSVFEKSNYDKVDLEKILRKQLGPEKIAQFKRIETTPFAAGSFAQVYRAQLAVGQDVIIKLLRPSIGLKLRADLTNLKAVVRIISLVRPAGLVDLKALFNDFSLTVKDETDYIKEATNTEWFYKHFKNSDSIVVPQVYRNLSTSSIITQDFIAGISLSELLTLKEQGDDVQSRVKDLLGSDFWTQMHSLGSELVHSTLWSDFMLGDPHPGNIKLLPDNKVGLIDFGLVARSPLDKQTYLEWLISYRNLYEANFSAGEFLLATIKFFDDDLASSIAVLQNYKRSSVNIFAKLNETAGSTYEASINTNRPLDSVRGKRIIKIFNTLINDNNRYGLRLNPQTAGMLKSARTYIQLLRQFSDDDEDQTMMQIILGEEVNFAMSNLNRLQQPTASREVELEHAFETISEWMTHIADADPALYSQINLSLMRRSYA